MDEVQLWILPQEDRPLARFSIFFIYSTILSVGSLLNIFVIYRMARLARKDRNQFLHGTGIFLCVMAVCDSFSLFSIFLQYLVSQNGAHVNIIVLSTVCKLSEFVSRFSVALSMYCWAFMSGLRYMAALHPLAYSTLCRSPFFPLTVVAMFAVIANLHILTSVSGLEEQLTCVFNLEGMLQLYSGVDLLLSYLAPCAVVLVMDIRVLCCRQERKTSDPLLQVVFHRKDDDAEKNRLSNMRRFMCITLIGLILASPENILRAMRICALVVKDSSISITVFHTVKLLFFVKLSLNAFYLSAYVFDRNVLSKTSSSRQLSISIRRLEENPSIIPRERSNTVSYRATTPIPVLTRNSSCSHLDEPSTPKKQAPKWV